MPGLRAGHPARPGRRRAGSLWVATGCLAAYLVMVAFPHLAPHDPLRTALLERLRPPSRTHWLGQDEVGRDVLSRIVHGARISLGIGLAAVVIGTLAGGLLGILSGYFRRLDGPIMRGVDVLMAFPYVLRAIAVVAILGPGFVNLFVAIAFGQIPTFARLVRGVVLGVKTEPFVEAARAVGAGHRRVLLRHILPQTLAPIGTFATLEMGAAILGAATLSFLGLGVSPPTPEWGAIASAGREHLRRAPHVVLFPSLAIFGAVWSFSLLGDAWRDRVDPRLRRVFAAQ
jgi:ABC-type dipeptide/oligopeptide/nickel transport system permease subunit